MEITAVNLARVWVFFPAGGQLTIGRVPFQQATKFLVDRYRFAKTPEKLEDWQSNDGAAFFFGQRDGIIVTRLVIYAGGFLVETHTNTDDCLRIVDDLMSAATAQFGVIIARPD